MDGSRVITIGRQDLYDRIWTTPMMAVCRDYGISNVGLAKVCRRHKIPCPPRGYWAKKHSEKSARRTPLPAYPDPERQIIKIYPTPPKQAVPAPAFDADIVALLDKARQPPMVTVPATLHNPHPLVRATRTRFDGARPDPHNLVRPLWDGEPTLAVAVGSGGVPRALRFLDALIKAVERLGGRVAVRTRERNGKRETVAEFCGEAVPFRLRERYRQMDKPVGKRDGLFGDRCEYVLTGEFILDRGPSCFDGVYGQDTTAAGRVEDQINEILVRLVTEAGKARVVRREREAEHRRREEQERFRREQAERERAERARVERLLADAEAWRRADALRGYIGVVEQLALARRVSTGEG
ncbi:MAG: hypothetical protein JWO38_8301, partial [Gemmataceae bacterium]|nr:hypothetical protein [Gemmataceae bacterium]